MLKFERILFKRGLTESAAYQWLKDFIFTKIQLIVELNQTLNLLNSLKIFLSSMIHYDTVETSKNIANGMKASEEANCHNEFEQVIKIMKGLVKTMASSNSEITIDKKNSRNGFKCNIS